ncbi:lysophospholipid acyltransferase family protein [Dethiothermospora halolimnae]|uniref:lysophospholipid acyltransferase family protein n=1 Tax=Dethiothermospora halolimnae TaxID=3114390 RepID=UPI003CCC3BA2
MTFYKFATKVVSLIYTNLFKLEINGSENIPQGKGIICSNHISMRDPIFLGISIDRQINFMAKRQLFKNKILRFILTKLGAFPVNRDGADLSSIKNSLKILKKEELLGIFPEGTRVKEENTSDVKPGIAMIAIKSKAPVIPVYIDTEYKKFKKVKVNIGKPLYFNDFYGKKLGMKEYKELSTRIMKELYNLK